MCKWCDLVLKASASALVQALKILTTVAGSLVLLSATGPALAQPGSGGAVSTPLIDNGAGTAAAIYQTNGHVSFTTTELVIGDPNQGGLAFQRVYLGRRGWRNGFIGTVTDDTFGTFTVSVGAHSEAFTRTGTFTFSSAQQHGSTLTVGGSGILVYTTADGTTYSFDQAYGCQCDPNSRDGQLVQVSKPNGEVLTYTYNQVATLRARGATDSRLQSVVSNSGYMMAFSYNADGSKDVVGINLAYDYCAPAANGCTGLTNSWPSMHYSARTTNSSGQGTDTATDPSGNVTTFTYGPQGIITSMQPPTGAPVSFTYFTPYENIDYWVQTVTTANGTYTNTYSNDGYNLTVVQTDPLGGQKSITTDPTGLVIRRVDELGRVTVATNGAYGLPAQVTHPEGNSESYIYDSRSNVVQATRTPKPGSSLSPIVTSATYSSGCAYPASCNKPLTTTDAVGNVTSYTYDNTTGFILSKTSPADGGGVQPQVRYGYSAVPTYGYASAGSWAQLGSITKLTSTSKCASGSAPSCVGTANEILDTSSYSGNNGLLASTTKGAGSGAWALNLTASFYYDKLGNTWAVVDPRGDQVQYAFDLSRRVSGKASYSSGGALLAYSAYYYDGSGRLTTELKATGIDASGNVTGWQPWQTSYSPTGKVATKTDPLSHVTQYSYDTLDRLSSVTDPTGYVTSFVYDAAGQKMQERRAVGTALEQAYASFTYSQNGKVLSETDARGNAINSSYDGFDRLYRTTYADGTFEQNDYNAGDDVAIWTNREGLAQIRCYDALGRKISERSVTGATNTGLCPTGGTPNQNSRWWDTYDRTFTYDLANRLLTADSANGWVHHMTYDSAGRTATHADNFGSFTYGYDASDNLVSIGYPTGHTVAYAYDGLDRMTNASLDGNPVATLSWDTLSRRTNTTFGDGSSTGYGFDAADRMTALSHSFPNSPGANVSFGFGFDDAGRLTSDTTTNSGYRYSPSTASISYATADALNRYPSVNGVSYSYWGTGSLSTDGALNHYYDQTGAHTLTYTASGSDLIWETKDALGQSWLRQHNAPSGSTSVLTYRSIGSNRPETVLDRIYTGTTGGASWPTWAGDRVYVLGPNPDERLAFEDTNGTIYYPHVDRQGSTVALSTGGSNVLTRSYSEYGLPNLAVAEVGPGASAYPYLYTGQRYDPTLLAYDYKARVYSATYGRFWQPDPIGPKDDLNLYGYVHGDPMNGADPRGTCTGSLIVNTDGTCASTGGSTTGLDGFLEGALRENNLQETRPIVTDSNQFETENYMVGDDFQLIEISNATGNVCTDAFLDCRKNKQSFMDQGPGHANDNAPQLNFDQPTGFPPSPSYSR